MANVNIPRHPHITEKLEIYRRIKILVENKEQYYADDDFMLKFPNETKNSRESRKVLFKPGFRNITLDLLSAIIDSVFQEKPRVEFTPEDSAVAKFAEDVTRGKDETSLIQYAKDFSAMSLRAYGQVWTVIDKPNYLAESFEDELRNGLPYITNISPLSVWGWEFVDGELIWFAYRVCYTPNWVDPTSPQPEDRDEIRIWTRDELIIIDQKNNDGIKRFPHSFGIVPIVYQSLFLPPEENTIVGIAPFFTTSNLIIMGNNMKSIADMELAKFGNSVLLTHREAISSMNTEIEEDGRPKTKFHDEKGFNQFVWDGEKMPEYLTKDLAAVEHADNRADGYFSWAIDNEKTMRSVMKKGASGQELSESGIAKSFDAMPVIAGLRTTAIQLESWSRKVCMMVGRITTDFDDDKIRDMFTIEYSRRFDIAQKTLEQRIKEIKEMQVSNYPSETGIKESWKRITPEITNNSDMIEQINGEIDKAVLPEEFERSIEKEVKLDIDGAENDEE